MRFWRLTQRARQPKNPVLNIVCANTEFLPEALSKYEKLDVISLFPGLAGVIRHGCAVPKKHSFDTQAKQRSAVPFVSF